MATKAVIVRIRGIVFASDPGVGYHGRRAQLLLCIYTAKMSPPSI